MNTRRLLPTPLARLILLAGACLPCELAIAQSQQPKVTSAPTLNAAPAKFNVSVGARGEYQFEADLDSGSGSVSVARAGANVGVNFGVGERARLGFTFDSEFSWYDWQNPTSLTNGSQDPWDDTVGHTLGVQLVVPGEGKWAWFVGAGVQASYEREADFSDSLTYGGQGGARYQFNDNFALSFGVAVRTRLEDDTLVLPIIGVEWKINEKLTLSTDRGTGVELRYQATDAVAITLEGGYDFREFRLSDDGPAPDGVGIDRRVPVAAGVIWTIAPTVSVNAKGGLIAWSTYKLEDDSGVKIAQSDADPAAFISLGVDFKF